jgi:hypothetical protein
MTATTGFALDLAIVGKILDTTVIKRQQRIEFKVQFEYHTSTTR